MRQIKFLVAIALVLALGVPMAKARPDKGNKLVGKWKVTDMQKNGKKEADVKGKTVTITSDTITCHDKDKKTEMACRYTLDTSTRPYHITMNCTEGEHKGKKLMGIVQMEGDTARVCFSKPGEKVPTSFKKTNDGQCCVTLKRID